MGCPVWNYMVFTSPPSLQDVTEKMTELSDLSFNADETTSDYDVWSASLSFQEFPEYSIELTCRSSEHSPQIGSRLPPELDLDNPWIKVAQAGQYCIEIETRSFLPELFDTALVALADLGGKYFEPLTGELQLLSEAKQTTTPMPVSAETLRKKCPQKKLPNRWLTFFTIPLICLYFVSYFVIGIPLMILGMIFSPIWKRLSLWLNPQYEQIKREKMYAGLLRRHPEAKEGLLRLAQQKSRNTEALADFQVMLERAAMRAEAKNKLDRNWH